MARFLNGLNHPIKKIADFQPYSNLIELVHQATKAERQVHDDFKYASTHPRPMVSPTKLQRLLQHLHQPSLLQATTTSQVTRKLHLVQVVLFLLQATSSRVLHHLLRPMRPSRQAPSSVSLAAAEATSPMNAQTSAP